MVNCNYICFSAVTRSLIHSKMCQVRDLELDKPGFKILPTPFTSSVTLDKLLNLSELLILYQNNRVRENCFMRLLAHAKCPINVSYVPRFMAPWSRIRPKPCGSKPDATLRGLGRYMKHRRPQLLEPTRIQLHIWKLAVASPVPLALSHIGEIPSHTSYPHSEEVQE